MDCPHTIVGIDPRTRGDISLSGAFAANVLCSPYGMQLGEGQVKWRGGAMDDARAISRRVVIAATNIMDSLKVSGISPGCMSHPCGGLGVFRNNPCDYNAYRRSNRQW